MELKTIRGGDYTAVINLSRGANCVSLRNAAYGAQILREPDYAKGELDNPFLYGMPILFPVNRISGGAFSFDGREYRFPVNEEATGCHLHGVLHAMPFSVEEERADYLAARFTAASGEVYEGFPHAFSVLTEYALSDGGLLHRVTVENRSDEAMPCLLGFHTTFLSRFTEGAREEELAVGVGILEEFERNMQTYLPTGRRPAPDSVTERLAEGRFRPIGERISRHYRGVGRMTLTDLGQGLSVVYEPDEKLPFRLVYNGDADGFICLEPQTSLANSPNAPIPRDEAGFAVLAPRGSVTYTSRIYLTKEERV